MLPRITIYTDGASSGKSDAPGGWSCILVFRGHEKALTGSDPKTTNQRMEMTAAIRGLQALTRPCEAMVISDSAYLVNCMQKGWHKKWRKNGWKNAKGKPVSNRDLWEELIAATARHKVIFVHVRGHNGHIMNERCDELAVMAKQGRIAGRVNHAK